MRHELLVTNVSPTCRVGLRLLAPLLLAAAGCAGGATGGSDTTPPGPDPHSFARPDEIRVRHVALELDVDFERRELRGRVDLHLERAGDAPRVWLDTSGLEIDAVTLLPSGRAAEFSLGDPVEYLGSPLAVELAPATEAVRIDYRTGPDATALQWLEPDQTDGGEQPFLLTQSQAIYARTWIPCQDSPAVRSTYEATVRVPAGLLALMSAENPTETRPDGVYRFRMPQAVPSYLLALAVGELEFRPLGPRSGVYAEPGVVDRAAWEFAETPQMIEAAEALYGDYRWGRYDLIVLPPSFPFGGMENPRLSFITPTLIAGDRSLVSTIAHELAHSWSGNLVTNASWADLWLNEGFTVYFEKRIMEALYGREVVDMTDALETRDLEQTLAELEERDQSLKLELAGRDPEDCFSDVAYQKGYLFLRRLEQVVGRPAWDRFLRDYFDRFAFGSMTTERFLGHLDGELWSLHPRVRAEVDVGRWVYGPGLPEDAPRPRSTELEIVERAIVRWNEGARLDSLAAETWTLQQRLIFLGGISRLADRLRLAELDRAWGLSESGNAELRHAWLMLAAGSGHEPAERSAERFLTEIGRLKFLRPLYRRLLETPEDTVRARRIYERARPGYHAITRGALDPVMGWPWS